MPRQLNAVYLMHSLVGLASSLIGIFIPAYLISLNFALAEIFLYFFTYALAVFFSFFGAALFSKTLGVRLMVIISFPFTLAHLALLYALDTTKIPILEIALIHGIGAGLYWFALHSFFASNAKDGEMGASVGKLFNFPHSASLFGPLIGGAIAFHYGFSTLFVFGGVVLLASAFVLMWIPDLSSSARLTFSTFISLFHRFKRYTFVAFFENIREELEAVVWPLFIFLLFQNTLSVGFAGTLAAVGAIVFTYFVAQYTDRINPKIFLRIGAVLMSIVWLTRYLWPDIPLYVYISTLIAGLLVCLIEVPFNTYEYTSAKRTNVIEFLVFREVPVLLARLTIYGIALMVVTSIPSLFLVGALATVLILLF